MLQSAQMEADPAYLSVASDSRAFENLTVLTQFDNQTSC